MPYKRRLLKYKRKGPTRPISNDHQSAFEVIIAPTVCTAATRKKMNATTVR